jgi:hypothetical protein
MSQQNLPVQLVYVNKDVKIRKVIDSFMKSLLVSSLLTN